MTQPLPEPRHFNPHGGQDFENSPNLLEGRQGIVAVVATQEAHASGWAAEATVGLAEASQRAGHPTGVLDLAVGSPRLHAAAGLERGEGLIDLVVFGASVSRVSNKLESGVRVITAGTPVGEESELWSGPDDDSEDDSSDSAWLGAARHLAGDGCVLVYVVAESVGMHSVLDAAEGVILVRHEGDGFAPLAATPWLVLEPQPAAQVSAEILPAPAGSPAGPGVSIGTEDEAEGLANPEVLPALEAEPTGRADDGVEEVVLDLDDVIDDSPLHEALLPVDAEDFTSMLADEAPEPNKVPDVDVSGLEVNSEWPAFQEPMEVQEPGTVDPLVAAAGGAETVAPDTGLDDIIGGESGLTIIDEDLVLEEASVGGVNLGEGLSEPIKISDRVDGLIDGGQDTLNRAGEESLPSADEVSGLDDALASPLHDPSGWGPPPSASEDGPAADLTLGDLAPRRDGLGDDAPTFAGPPSERLGMENPQTESGRLADPWGEPIEEPEPAVAEAPVLDAVPLADEAAPVSDQLPWEDRADEKGGAVTKEAAVPVADVTRIRTRTRSNGPRPFLLVLFLLLIITVGVLWWVEVLDVPLLDGLRGGTP